MLPARTDKFHFSLPSRVSTIGFAASLGALRLRSGKFIFSRTAKVKPGNKEEEPGQKVFIIVLI